MAGYDKQPLKGSWTVSGAVCLSNKAKLENNTERRDKEITNRAQYGANARAPAL
jgi:hypothetical protein